MFKNESQNLNKNQNNDILDVINKKTKIKRSKTYMKKDDVVIESAKSQDQLQQHSTSNQFSKIDKESIRVSGFSNRRTTYIQINLEKDDSLFNDSMISNQIELNKIKKEDEKLIIDNCESNEVNINRTEGIKDYNKLNLINLESFCLFNERSRILKPLNVENSIMMEFINKKKISSFSIENLNFIQIFKKKKENFQFLPNENTNFEYLTPKIQNDDYDKEIEIKGESKKNLTYKNSFKNNNREFQPDLIKQVFRPYIENCINFDINKSRDCSFNNLFVSIPSWMNIINEKIKPTFVIDKFHVSYDSTNDFKKRLLIEKNTNFFSIDETKSFNIYHNKSPIYYSVINSIRFDIHKLNTVSKKLVNSTINNNFNIIEEKLPLVNNFSKSEFVIKSKHKIYQEVKGQINLFIEGKTKKSIFEIDDIKVYIDKMNETLLLLKSKDNYEIKYIKKHLPFLIEKGVNNLFYCSSIKQPVFKNLSLENSFIVIYPNLKSKLLFIENVSMSINTQNIRCENGKKRKINLNPIMIEKKIIRKKVYHSEAALKQENQLISNNEWNNIEKIILTNDNDLKTYNNIISESSQENQIIFTNELNENGKEFFTNDNDLMNSINNINESSKENQNILINEFNEKVILTTDDLITSNYITSGCKDNEKQILNNYNDHMISFKHEGFLKASQMIDKNFKKDRNEFDSQIREKNRKLNLNDFQMHSDRSKLFREQITKTISPINIDIDKIKNMDRIINLKQKINDLDFTKTDHNALSERNIYKEQISTSYDSNCYGVIKDPAENIELIKFDRESSKFTRIGLKSFKHNTFLEKNKNNFLKIFNNQDNKKDEIKNEIRLDALKKLDDLKRCLKQEKSYIRLEHELIERKLDINKQRIDTNYEIQDIKMIYPSNFINDLNK